MTNTIIIPPNTLTLYIGECYLNEAIAYLISITLHNERKPKHCQGVTVCLSDIHKITSTSKDKIKDNFSIIRFLVIDREYNKSLRKALEVFMEKYRCKIICDNRNIKVYRCKNSIILLVFWKPPEDIIAELDQHLASILQNPEMKKRFKKRKEIFNKVKNIAEKLKNTSTIHNISMHFDCHKISDNIERGICILYSEVIKTLKACNTSTMNNVVNH